MKLIVVSKSNKKNILSAFLGAIFTNEYVDCITGAECENLLLRHKPDFVLFNDIKPVNGMDMMEVLRHIDGNIRLRVAIFQPGKFKEKERRFLSPVNSC